MTRPDGSTEMAACILVWCAEHGISTDSDYVIRWLDEYWSRRFATLDAEATVALGVVADAWHDAPEDGEPGSPAWLDKHAGESPAIVDPDAKIKNGFRGPRPVVCQPGSRCGDHTCPVCGAH